MAAKLFFTTLLACLLVQFTGCKKTDDKNLLVSSSKVTFDYNEQTMKINISDIGSDEFTWSVSSPSDLLEFSKTSGTCSKNNPDEFDINLLRERIHQDSITTTVTVAASTGEKSVISVLILGFPEKKIRYNSQIYAAAYDQVTNRLILLSALNSSRVLDIYDIATDRFSHIPLNGSGNMLSVSPDGTYAVTNSDNNYRIMYIDLVQEKVVSTFSIEQFSNSIIACANKVCYYFPYYNNSEIGKLNLNTGTYASYNTVLYYDLESAVLHPSGNYIYTAGYSQVAKFNIAKTEPSLVYTSSGYNTNSKIWISKDGTRLFTAGKKVLTIDPSLPQNDITGSGDVNIQQQYIYSLDHNPVHNEFYVIPTNSSYSTDYQSNQVLVLNNDLSPVRSIMLEPYHVQYSYNQQFYTTVDAVGQYVFASSDGSRIIVVSKASDYYSNAYGIEIIDRNRK